MNLVRWVAVLSLTVVSLHAQGGEITGHVRVTTTLTKKRVSLPQVYERHVAIAPPQPRNDREDELRRVVVYLEGQVRSGRTATASAPARIDQKNRRFEPEVLAVEAGAAVSFPNSDPIFHNVFSLSRIKQFDLGNYAAGETRTVTFDEPGLIQLHCHLHPNMSGAILVTPNRWHTQPDTAGNFLLKDVPPGRYSITAWHKSAGYFRRRIQVPVAGAASIDFEIPLPAEALLKESGK